MKKLASLLLALVMLLSAASIAMADEPIHITFWHTRGAGAQLDAVVHAVDTFNATVGKEKGIEVEQLFIGNYEQLLTKLQLQSQSGDMPELAIVAATVVPDMVADGLAADLTEYATRDGFDTANLMDVFNEPFSVMDGKLVSLPYIRSTAVFVYNKTMADAANLTAPKTIEEMEAFGKALTKKDEKTGETLVYGFQLHSDFVFFNSGMLKQLGGGFLAEDGMSCPALEDGSMLTMLSAWRRWVDEGWCQPFASTQAATVEKEAYYQGRLASFYTSCGGLKDIKAKSVANNIELGVAMLPAWGDPAGLATSVGGGNIFVPTGDNSKEEIEAGWEFAKFLMTDEMVAYNAINSGYLPVTKSVAQYQGMVDFWAENPEFKVAYDQLAYAFNNPVSEYFTDIKNACSVAVSLLIQEQSITAEEAVKQIQDEAAVIF